MLLFRATATDLSKRSIRVGGGVEVPEAPRAFHPLLHSLAPAIDAAFGLEHAALFPDAITALVAELEAGPLGAAGAVPAAPPDRQLERA